MSLIHYIYIGFVLLIFGTLLTKKDIVIPCIIGIFAIGFIFSGNVIFAIQTIYNTLIFAGIEFWGIIVIISLVVAMSKALSEVSADELMIAPIKKIMINENVAYFVVGIIMLIVSWLIWPSPSVALIGAILLPAAIKSGLPAIWAASAMNLFGHGIGLSSDFFIQGAPTVTAKAANVPVSSVMQSSLPIWLTMSVVTIFVSYIMFRKDMKANKEKYSKMVEYNNGEKDENLPAKTIKTNAKIIAVLTPIAFVLDIIVMWKMGLTGGDATALVGGTAIIIMLAIVLTSFSPAEALDKAVDYLKDGFGFGIKVFAPVIIIGGFFFLGNEGIAKSILGENATGLLNDISSTISQSIGVSKFSAIISQVLVSITTGLDGSGFSGLPIVGALAYTFGEAMTINTSGLASLGQIVTVWVGGGTVIPWAVIPVAAICGVSPAELVRKNVVPVCCGLVAAVLVSFIVL